MNPIYIVEAEMTLIEALNKIHPQSSNRTLRHMITQHRVTVEGEYKKQARLKLVPGQEVEIHPKPAQEKAEKDHRVSVLYEDEHIIAVNKPTGLLSIASDKMEEDTLHTRVLNYLRSNDSKAWGYIIHRLDRETSGIIIFAKSEQAKESVQTQFAEHQVRRYYTAIVEGEPSEDNGTAKHYLQEDKNLRVWVVEPGSRGAKEAVTHWYVLERNGATSRIELDIETGRRHQIRVQMAEMGHPLVGDRRHESVFDPLGRLCLHATTLQFKHPISGKKLNLDSATPREFDIIASYSIDDMD